MYRQVDLLKIDVERAELEVLAGVEAAHWPLIRQVGVGRGPYGKGSYELVVSGQCCDWAS